MSSKNKTAIGNVLTQLKEQTLNDASAVKPLKKSPKDKALADFNFLRQEPITSESVIEIQPDACILWEYKDRLSCDLGNIEELAKDILENGQAQPGVVRPYKLNNNINKIQYEIIVGERRWRACKKTGVMFKAICRDVTDKQATILQATENLNREDLSDYSKGMNYYRLIKSGCITQKELQEKLSIPKATMSHLLSFASIPKIVLEKIEDPSKISANVASLIRAYCKKGDTYITAIIQIASELSKGIGANNFTRLVNNELLGKKTVELSKKVVGKENNLLFTIKNNGKYVSGISFAKSTSKHLDFDKIEQALIREIEEQMFNEED